MDALLLPAGYNQTCEGVSRQLDSNLSHEKEKKKKIGFDLEFQILSKYGEWHSGMLSD